MKKQYILKFREPGKRPNTERWGRREVDSVAEAEAWMNANKSCAFLPAFVNQNTWKAETVAILK